MKKTIYDRTIKRDSVEAGLVVSDSQLQLIRRNPNQKLNITDFKPYRSILFVADSDGKTFDLLYNSPKYPLEDSKASENPYALTVVTGNVNIGPLLKYYGYPEFLDFEDALNIRKTFFDGNFAQNNSEVFGLVKLPFEQLLAQEKTKAGNQESLLKLSRIVKSRYRYDESAYTETTIYDECPPEVLSSYVLDVEYFRLLNKLGDHTINDVMKGYVEKTDAFKPNKEEGQIRSRKKAQY